MTGQAPGTVMGGLVDGSVDGSVGRVRDFDRFGLVFKPTWVPRTLEIKNAGFGWILGDLSWLWLILDGFDRFGLDVGWIW